MDYAVFIAKQLRERDNIKSDEPTIGEVVSTDPLVISIFSGQVLLNYNLVELSNDFCILNGTCEVDGKIGTCSIDRTLKAGEYVKCIPTSSGQKWFIVR
jgi:hypothetical protein